MYQVRALIVTVGVLISDFVITIVVTMVGDLTRAWVVYSIELLIVTFISGCHTAKQKGKLGNKNQYKRSKRIKHRIYKIKRIMIIISGNTPVKTGLFTDS